MWQVCLTAVIKPCRLKNDHAEGCESSYSMTVLKCHNLGLISFSVSFSFFASFSPSCFQFPLLSSACWRLEGTAMGNCSVYQGGHFEWRQKHLVSTSNKFRRGTYVINAISFCEFPPSLPLTTTQGDYFSSLLFHCLPQGWVICCETALTGASLSKI